MLVTVIPSLSPLNLNLKNQKVDLLLEIINFIDHYNIDMIVNDEMSEQTPEYTPSPFLMITEPECFSPTSLPTIYMISITAAVVIIVMTALFLSLLAVYKVIRACTKSQSTTHCSNRGSYHL